MQRLQDQDRRGDINRHRRPTPTGREQIREQRLREQHPAMLSQQPEHTAPVDQMPSHRLGIQQLTLIKATTLHHHIVSPRKITDRDDTLCSAGS